MMQVPAEASHKRYAPAEKLQVLKNVQLSLYAVPTFTLCGQTFTLCVNPQKWTGFKMTTESASENLRGMRLSFGRGSHLTRSLERS